MNNLVRMDDKQVVTSSRQVAEVFDKTHDNVMRDIRRTLDDLSHSSKMTSEFFYESEYVNSRGRTYTEYLMNRDGFTLLAMGFTGKEATQWKVKYIEAFNKMEEQLTTEVKSSYMIEDPIARAKVWIKEQQEREQLQLETQQQRQIIGELKPKADYTDKILQSDGLLTVRQIAKDYGMSAQKFNSLLHDCGIQYKQSGQWLLYQEYQGKGYTHSKTIYYETSTGTGTSLQTKWRQKGRLFLYNFLKEEGILPTIEKEEYPEQ